MQTTQLPVMVSENGSVGIIQLARPEIFNCLSLRTFKLIDEARRRFEADGRIRVILVCAQGKNFCTGAELGEVKARRGDREALAAFIDQGHRVLSALEASPLPVVAAVQGLCLAGGLELVLACDVVFAARTARFGDQHAQYGLVPGWGGTQRLARTIGLRRALDLCFSARWIEAPTAWEWGLVSHLADADTLDREAMAYCTTLAERSAPGIALMKQLARQGLDQTLEAGLRLEAAAVVDALQSPDVAEGLSAFEARRKPEFG